MARTNEGNAIEAALRNVAPYVESNYEGAVIELLESMGYHHVKGPDVPRNYQDPIYADEFDMGLKAINQKMPQSALNEAKQKVLYIENGDLAYRNKVFTDYLQNGVSVSYRDGTEVKSGRVLLVDFAHPDRNSFVVANQWTFIEQAEKRADIVLFVNGLPLVVMELKSPIRTESNTSTAYAQLQEYKRKIPSFFVYNVALVMSDMLETRAGSVTADETRFLMWKTVDGNYEHTKLADWSTLFKGMFAKGRFLDIIENFQCYSSDGEEHRKILAAYHQYYAVHKAIESTKKAVATDGRAGVFWHTQGSGKSLSMVFYAKLLQRELNSPTIVVITDRNDLDDQLYSQFCMCSDYLRQTPHHVSDRRDLKRQLNGIEANGIFFTTMQKFEESDEPLSKRKNIIVMADEAHRGQYGFEHVDTETGAIRVGFAQIIRNSFPQATFIGFTGTPIEKRDRNTREVFGDYIDIYDMTQAVEDGATKPIYYESRVVHMEFDEDVMAALDREYQRMEDEDGLDAKAIAQSKRDRAQLESILGAPATIDKLCDDIVTHYEENRQYEQTGKAMIVAYSRAIAISIYKRILEIRPGWESKITIVMTTGANDTEEWRKLIGDKKAIKQKEQDFKDNNSELKIVIVVDMLLTGFDVPSLSTMYIYKSMEGHNLMQAIARVNRVFRDKVGGLVVDYIGIAANLKKAMHDYTRRDRENFSNQDVGTAAYPKFQEKLEVCRGLLFGFDYSRFASGSNLDRTNILRDGVNFLCAPEKQETKKNFMKEATLLKQAFSLCRSITSKEERMEAGLFLAIQALLRQISTPRSGGISIREINEKVNDLLKQSIKSDGVIDLFSDVQHDFSIFDEKFLQEIARMKTKNLAIEMLHNLINEQVKAYNQTKLVKAEEFSEMLKKTMNAYLNGLISSEQVIEELLALAKCISEDKNRGNELGLTEEEMAFYDALMQPRAVRDFYDHDQLKKLTIELTDMLRKSRTIDWQQKESARADMRRKVKRLLKHYHYPPDDSESAMATVIKQCELWTDHFDMYTLSEKSAEYYVNAAEPPPSLMGM